MKPSERPPLKNAASVANLLKELFNRRGYETKVEEYRAFVLWDKIVGEQIAARTRPVRIRDGVMHIQVDHAVWMQQLQLLKPKILEKIKNAIPETEIRDLFFRVSASIRAKGAPPPEEKTLPIKDYLTDDDRAAIHASTQWIEDTETRDALTSLLLKQRNLSKAKDNEPSPTG